MYLLPVFDGYRLIACNPVVSQDCGHEDQMRLFVAHDLSWHFCNFRCRRLSFLIEVTLFGSTSIGLAGCGPHSFGQDAHVSRFRGVFYANVGVDPLHGEALETFQVATLDGRNQHQLLLGWLLKLA